MQPPSSSSHAAPVTDATHYITPVRPNVLITQFTARSQCCVLVKLSALSACLTAGSFGRCGTPEEIQEVQRRGWSLERVYA